ncbi:hypothetical protein BGZ61DRAFT_348366, partial [Ilyonectria robusta]|uniref:uncharacterized protein n=1 Tax=Ilyonectria robusta TaxID=1079257 RepID=UPI001E8E4B09
YPILHDGPVGKPLKFLKRHPYRPSRMHFMFEKPGYDDFITQVAAISPVIQLEESVCQRRFRSLFVKD